MKHTKLLFVLLVLIYLSLFLFCNSPDYFDELWVLSVLIGRVNHTPTPTPTAHYHPIKIIRSAAKNIAKEISKSFWSRGEVWGSLRNGAEVRCTSRSN